MRSALYFPRQASLVAIGLLTAVTAMAVDIQPPKTQVIDRYNVNMTNGQVTHSIGTVSIGGAMGLSHSISIDANEFNYQGYRGFRDKFFGQARNVTLSTDPYFVPQNVLRVSDGSETAEFEYYIGSARQNSGIGITGGYRYVSHGDERHTLDWDANYLTWTKPDGTLVHFSRTSSPDAASSALLTDITYPNGFHIDVYSAGMGVSTNTGFQLKAFYPPDTRPLDKTDDNRLVGTPAANSASWASANPKYIKAINAAIDYCAPQATDWTSQQNCNLTKPWPMATFNWPAGMPRTMFIGNTQVSVVDMLGRTTTLTYSAYDLAYATTKSNGSIVATRHLWEHMSPRLVGFRTSGTPDDFTYDYRNVYVTAGDTTSDFGGAWDMQLQTAGVVISATRHGIPSGYDLLGRNQGGDLLMQNYGSSNGVTLVQVHLNTPGGVGALYYANTEEGTINYENTSRNFPSSFVPSFGPTQDFVYERSNLKQINYQQQVPSEMHNTLATYPASCDPPANRKTCNQASAIRDANGNWTYYTYHDSGQVESILRPTVNSVAPETHYQYQQLSAHYYSPINGAWITGPGIWLKTAERYCINSNYSSRLPTATCGKSDEVVTRYEYNHNNLLLTGMTVTSPPPPSDNSYGPPYNTTYRTCFKYDIYGNQIGKTEPNANLASCP